VSGENFPTDIKNCMKDCILTLLWPKKDVFAFLRDNGCTTADLQDIEAYKEENVARGVMVDRVFERLAARADGGLGALRAMLKALVEWSHFDAYYFDKLAKLDHATAQKHLDHLRQLVEIRDSRIKEERERREAAAQQQQFTKETRQSLLHRFLDLHKNGGKPQDRGYVLEKLFQDLVPLHNDYDSLCGSGYARSSLMRAR
jgi:hypothetical protein